MTAADAVRPNMVQVAEDLGVQLVEIRPSKVNGALAFLNAPDVYVAVFAAADLNPMVAGITDGSDAFFLLPMGDSVCVSPIVRPTTDRFVVQWAPAWLADMLGAFIGLGHPVRIVRNDALDGIGRERAMKMNWNEFRDVVSERADAQRANPWDLARVLASLHV